MQLNETLSALAKVSTDRADFFNPIEMLRGEHERQREFCGRLLALADDIWQLGHEKLAASLLDFAVVDMADNMDDQTELLAQALLRRRVPETASRGVVNEMIHRHQGVATLATPTIDGLNRLAKGDVPPVPTQFILSALGLVETLRQNLDWEETVLLPLVASSLTEADRRQCQSNLG